MECLLIDSDTKIGAFTKELRWNEMYYHWADGM